MVENRTDPLLETLVAGRSQAEQLECIRRYGNHGITPILRQMLINNLGIARPKPTAENVIIFGCYIPFTMPLQVRNYLKLLDILGIDYSYLKQEYCCGSPLRRSAGHSEQDQALQASKEFMHLNYDLALQKGAKNLAYCCTGCAYSAKSFFPGKADHHKYYFELFIDKIEQKPLKVAPITMGYFEGCKISFYERYPEAEVDWKRCRILLDRIEGLRIVDLPDNICCSDKSKDIVETARQQELDTILCSCNGCYGRLSAAARGKLEVKFLTELLLEAIETS